MTETLEYVQLGDNAELASDTIANNVFEKSLEYRPLLAACGVERTPLEQADFTATLPELEGYTILTKDESRQPVHSYKVRGGVAGVWAARERGETTCGVAAASQGNHAQGVAFAAKALNVGPVVIEATNQLSPAKRQPLEDMDAHVNAVHATLEMAREVAQSSPMATIEPFDSLDTMAGQASMAHEILEDLYLGSQAGEINLQEDDITVLYPVGGGGALAGGAAVFKQARDKGILGENFRLFGVQMENCDALARSLKGGALTSDELDATCDGTAVLTPGKKTQAVIADKEYVEDVITVPKHKVGSAMQAWLRAFGVKIEPAGALALAGATQLARQEGKPMNGKRHVMVTLMTGANVSEATFHDFECAANIEAFRQLSATYLNRKVYGLEEVAHQSSGSRPARSANIF